MMVYRDQLLRDQVAQRRGKKVHAIRYVVVVLLLIARCVILGSG